MKPRLILTVQKISQLLEKNIIHPYNISHLDNKLADKEDKVFSWRQKFSSNVLKIDIIDYNRKHVWESFF